ncbi:MULTISPECIES: RICIN domain-containing protein [Bacillus cereus group]|uniref:RICIN domain-containing protein n=1 Tax=Bacillus cereus group TaxID=86661 RepID=UPI000BEFE1A7|nr:RICIN domain-containing protein [Bacillus toyonensis]PEO30846.1 toxin [Bacillus toyonensis]PGE63993.1 toxin [Bacillus toyonensis]PHD39053.1 toxin [Bacillus toyonensis]
MKSMSKKVTAGLLVGATSLSIWAPSSEAAAPAKNEYHTIHLAANSSIVWDVYKGWESDDAGIILWNGSRGDNEQFVFFPLDGGTYAIVNKNSGKPVGLNDGSAKYWTDGVRNSGVNNVEALRQKSWTGAANEQWYLRDKGNNNYEIVNQGNGKVASWAGSSVTGGYLDYVDLDNSNPSDNNRLFNIPAASSTFSLPTLPAVGTRPEAPKYTEGGANDQQLPQTSNSVVVGASLVPCIMVKDSQASDYTKIHNSPYYTLVKEEYWDKTFSAVIPAGLTRNYTFKTGMTSVDQQKMTDTLSMKIGADFGLKFGDASASIKSEISKTIQTEISTTNTEATEETITSSVTSEPGKTTGFTEYQLATKYTLKRADGSVVSDPWVVKNNKITVARKI